MTTVMKKVIPILLVAVMCCLASCNEKPKSYKFVTLAKDGQEKVEEFQAPNDIEALKAYFDRLEKVIVENIGKEPSYEAMYVISPEGDTLNTDKELLQSIMKDIPVMQDIAAPPAQPAPKQ